MKKSVVMLLLIVAVGCDTGSRVMPLAELGELIGPTGSYERGKDAIFTGVSVTDQGAEINPSTEFQQRCLTRLNQAGVFRRVYAMGDVSAAKDAYHISLRVEQIGDPREDSNRAKGLLVGVFLFVPAAFVRFDAEFTSKMELDVHKSGKVVATYGGTATGTAWWQALTSAYKRKTEWQRAVGGATTSALNQVLRRLLDDKARYDR